MKPRIAVPYFPGSNGDFDAIERIKESGMGHVPLYFHIGDEERLMRNASILAEEMDGAVLPGGFPYQDRIDFGTVPAKIRPFAKALRGLVDKGKPVIAFCSGNQIAHAMRLAFPSDTDYKAAMLTNICDTGGRIVTYGFLDKELYTRLECSPERTAFTRHYTPGEIVPGIIDHGGGRFWADAETLRYLLTNGMVVSRYCDNNGNVIDDFPVNPNGSMLNIEAITNLRGNLKIGMVHNERKINALYQDRGNLVFASMREFIEDGCPDLSRHAKPQDIPIELKDYSYLSHEFDPSRTLDIFIKMLTDDNERTTAQLFLGEGCSIDRRRLLRLELAEEHMSEERAKEILTEIAQMDFFNGIMLKKDLPYVRMPDGRIFAYEVVGKEGGKLIRRFNEYASVVEGFPVMHEQVGIPNLGGHEVRDVLRGNESLRDAVRHVHTGKAWFFRDEQSKRRALEELLG